MPLITLTLLKGRDPKEKKDILDAVHTALVNSGVPAADRFQRILELEPDNFIYDTHYPDLENARTDKFVIIEILLSVGRSVKIKRKILADLMEELKRKQISTNDIMVCFKETQWENWAFANGTQIHI
ncbi:tautomerase family protein [Mucilaginibacter sp. X4EP1]|uniref:tautomerase family protein n=1 Tax=Mucilaginibacter sp. X4EP1 TaxID=2723092 RepID=UPI0021689237|nr:tautomerase family protein [Mucilaginibacter sp. X4EP1]MCS3814968.1 5-carboxymethyl-2-hydroxymuconate isomerase [Mucilaginibacter sp. X4EP1]